VGGAKEGLRARRIARRATRALALGTPRRASAGFWWGCQDGEAYQECRKRALDPLRGEFAGRLRTLAGKRVVADEWTSEAQPRIGEQDQPGPAVGLFRRADSGQGPIERLFAETEGINPIAVLFWTAVINGFLAPPLLILIMFIANNRTMMGKRTNNRVSNALGWLAAVVMVTAAIALVLTWGR
jgi:hypothetical protein